MTIPVSQIDRDTAPCYGAGPVDSARPQGDQEPVYRLEEETEDDWWEVEALYDLCFAPGRTALSSYRLRDGVPTVAPLCLTLRDDVLPALGLGVTQAAEQLGVSRVALSRMLNGRAAISPDMALRLEAWLGVERGGNARVWLAEQSAYDVWQAEQRFKAKPMRVKPAPAMAA